MGFSFDCSGRRSVRGTPALAPRKVIAVLDTVSDKSVLDKSYMCSHVPRIYRIIGKVPKRDHFHSTIVIDLIGERIDTSKYCVISIETLSFDKENMSAYLTGLRYLKTIDNLVAVNLSIASDPGQQYEKDEHTILNDLLSKGVKIIVAAGNNSLELTKKECGVYPACLKARYYHANPNFIVAGWGKNQKPISKSNWAREFPVVLHELPPGLSGSSFAVPIETGNLFSK